MTIETLGSVQALWRYPVKSMQGELIPHTAITARGIVGDRTYAILERATGHIASAKHPRKWSTLLACRATFIESPQPGDALPPIWITLPDSTRISSLQADVHQVLSRVLGREVLLVSDAPPARIREADRTPLDGNDGQEIIREEPMGLAAPDGSFFDYAPLHILTTATLQRLQQLYPAGCFDVRRFRPNIVVAAPGEDHQFIEQTWLDQTITVGNGVQLRTIDPCPRCVVTTLGQDELPRDPGILRTLGQHTASASVTLAPGVVFPAVAGIYAHVQQSGVIRRGDVITRG